MLQGWLAMDLTGCALVLAGGFLGGILRVAVSAAMARAVGESFPWGTLVVNVSGAFVIGALAGLAPLAGGVLATPGFRAFAVVGILGGYTTVSSFALQTVQLALAGRRFWSAFNVVASTTLCLAAVAGGFWTAGRLFA